jgi:hypothetical protein
MNITDLPSQIRECVDEGTSPVTVGEIRARAVLTEPLPRPVAARRRTGLGLAAAGLAAAGIAGTLVASQTGGGTATVLTAATLRQVAGASWAAMTSGQADILWTGSASSTVAQHIAFDGANWNDEIKWTGAQVRPGTHITTWTGKQITRVVDGRSYHYPALAFRPKLHFTPGWMLMLTPRKASLDIPDPRTLLGVLSPSAGFVTDGYATVNGVRLQHLRATTPGAVPLRPLEPIIQSEPTSPRASALDLWVNPSDVVVKALIRVTGADTSSIVTVTVTFSNIGQPQAITAPAHYTTVGGKG